ncbi:hypothetical protein PVK06_027231 [Gossypium arboreum]|uniref:Reverse transcriptase n=1 Tax=Gossypium arboreum TaxID=29729 RepID=A0ABR0P086_GOSAR|nr:hypothetical protein PVK06_027231 [Gossypium arboreum]
MAEFRNVLEECSLNDLGFIDQSFEKASRQAWADPTVSVPGKLTKAGQQFKLWSCSKTQTQKQHRIFLEKRLFDLYDQDPTDEILAEIMEVALKHFGDLYTASESDGDDQLLGFVEQRITKRMNYELLKPFPEDEIWQVVKTIVPLKAPEIDGFPVMFYQRLGFQPDWIVLIMRCVCSITYTMGINEGLSLLLNEAKLKNLMRGAPIGRERFAINHLLFADDCILFGDASEDGAHIVRNIIMEYELVSGQQVNFDKSLIYFRASVGRHERDQVTNILGVQVVTTRRNIWAYQ